LKLNDPMDPSALAAATQERLSAASGGSAPAGYRKTSASSTTAAAAALPAINPLLSRSAHVRRGAEKTVTSGHENKFNDSGKIVERRLMAPLHRRS
jgi:hypothetical protein